MQITIFFEGTKPLPKSKHQLAQAYRMHVGTGTWLSLALLPSSVADCRCHCEEANKWYLFNECHLAFRMLTLLYKQTLFFDVTLTTPRDSIHSFISGLAYTLWSSLSFRFKRWNRYAHEQKLEQSRVTCHMVEPGIQCLTMFDNFWPPFDFILFTYGSIFFFQIYIYLYIYIK